MTPNTRGMLAITAASSIFVFSDALAKVVGQSWPVAQFLAIRGLFAIGLGLAMVIATGEGRRIVHLRNPLIILRSIVEATIAFSFISALGMMPLADLTAVLMVSPLCITIISIFAFGEVVRWRRWSAIAAGFFGMLLVVQPGGAASAAPNYLMGALLGMVAVLGVAVRDVVTRKLGDHIPSVVVTLATAIGSFSAGAVMSTFTPWQAFAVGPFVLTMLAAVLLTAGNLLLIIGCRGVDLSVVAPYRYSGVIWAIGVGYLVFGDIPNALSILGMVIIVASGVYTLHRERIRRRESAAAAAQNEMPR